MRDWKEVVKEMWEQNRSNTEDVFTLPEFTEIMDKYISQLLEERTNEAYKKGLKDILNYIIERIEKFK